MAYDPNDPYSIGDPSDPTDPYGGGYSSPTPPPDPYGNIGAGSIGGDYDPNAGGSGALSPADISVINQTPGLMDYLTKGLGLKPGDIAGLISRFGSVALMVAGVVQGGKNTQSILDSVAQTGQYNREALTYGNVLNNPDVKGPLQSSTWSGPDASGRYTRTDALSPGQQTLLTGTETLGAQRNTLAGGALDQLGAKLSQPFGLAGNVPMVDMNKMGAGIQSDPGAFGPIQGSLDFSGAPAMPIADEALRQKVTDDVIAQHKPAFDAKWNEMIRATDTQLRNEGIGPETPAYKAQMKNIYDDMGTAWNELQRGATAEGLSSMNTRFGENMASRQQGVGETTTQGTFANTAQGQNAEQMLAAQTAHNAAQQQGTGQYLAGTATNQAGRGQQFGEYLAGYTVPADLATSLQAGGKPTIPATTAPVGQPAQQAPANPYLANTAGATQATTNLNVASDFLTRTLPSWYAKPA